jgi:hypothetical protein
MVKNPFKTASDALDPAKKKPLPVKASPKAVAATSKAKGSSRQAAIDAAERRRAAAKSKFPAKPSTNKGRTR